MTTTTPSAAPRPAAPVLARQLLDGRRGQVGWSLALAAVVGLYLPLYPSLQSQQLTDLVDSLPAELVQVLGFDRIATGAGYTQATFFGLVGFVLAAAASTGWGAAAIAGAEESGRLELTLAHAVSRTRYALESAAAVVVRCLALGVVAFALVLAVDAPAQLGIDATDLLAASAAWTGLALLPGTAALAVGAVTGRRSWATGAGAGTAVLAYALDAAGRTGGGTAWLADVSPYHWAFGADPLADGFDWAGLGLLWGGSAVLVGVAAAALARRDVLG